MERTRAVKNVEMGEKERDEGTNDDTACSTTGISCFTECPNVVIYVQEKREVVTWNSQSGNSRGRESPEFPLEFPARKRPFFGNSLEFPYRGGSVHTEGLFLHTEGGVLVAFRTGTPQNFLHAAPWLLICRGGCWLLVSQPSERARHLKSTITK